MPNQAGTEAGPNDATIVDDARITEVLSRWWGFDHLRPLQSEAIKAALEGRDSLVVMPTGGGKSLCYQLPPLVGESTDVVISPLVALMKDQVDALEAIGYPAAALHGGMSQEERADVRPLLLGHLRVERGRGVADRLEGVDLILHQRHQRRDDDVGGLTDQWW